jgi:hypothetical protein
MCYFMVFTIILQCKNVYKKIQTLEWVGVSKLLTGTVHSTPRSEMSHLCCLLDSWRLGWGEIQGGTWPSIITHCCSHAFTLAYIVSLWLDLTMLERIKGRVCVCLHLWKRKRERYINRTNSALKLFILSPLFLPLKDLMGYNPHVIHPGMEERFLLSFFPPSPPPSLALRKERASERWQSPLTMAAAAGFFCRPGIGFGVS